jgi:hypothetical protein
VSFPENILAYEIDRLTSLPRVQKNAKHPDTFLTKVISLPAEKYKSMVRTMNLPYRGIETTSTVGPFFWCAHDQDDDDPHLREFTLLLNP